MGWRRQWVEHQRKSYPIILEVPSRGDLRPDDFNFPVARMPFPKSKRVVWMFRNGEEFNCYLAASRIKNRG